MEVTKLAGEVAISNLPPHRGLIVSLAFFEVGSSNSQPPYNGDPPAEVVIDCSELYHSVDLNSERVDTSLNIPFSVEHASGHYYLQLRTILYRKHNDRMLAQSEQFFFGRRPLSLLADVTSLTLPIEWPSIRVEELHHYGSIRPRPRRND